LTKVLVLNNNGCPASDVIKLVLASAGFEVRVTACSAEQLRAAVQWDPDVIILDVLPPTNGAWQDCQAIQRYCRAPILVLSIENDPHSIAKALDGGADDYLSKPISADVLTAHVNRLARRARFCQAAP